MLNSRLGLLAATRYGLGSESRHHSERPFFRSYGANLPSSLTWFLSRTLGFSPCLPVSVCGTDMTPSTLRRFSWQYGISESRLSCDAQSLRPLDIVRRICLSRPSYGLRPALPIAESPSLLRPAIALAPWYRNINLLSIDYAFRPRLRTRLTLGGRTFPRKP